ncbi:hypothetical protein Tco_0210067 [Tanacetum coccineum]
MVPNIWSPIKVAYDKYALWGISHWREQRNSLYAYARGIQSRGDVYSTKNILAVTHVKVMRKHGYGYLEEIVVRRADNILYTDSRKKRVRGIFNLELKLFNQKRLQVPSLILQDLILENGTRTLHTKNSRLIFVETTRGNRHYQEYRHGVLAEEKMEHIGKEKSSFHDQGHQQAAKGKEDDEEFGEIYWRFNTTAGNPVKKIILKLNLSDHRSILTDSKEYCIVGDVGTGLPADSQDSLPLGYTNRLNIKKS